MACLGLPLNAVHAAKTRTPEDETLEISRLLRPVPDEEWRTIAGDRLAEEYTIIKGDTLYDISNRLFGDPRYWPKIWALNNQSITNPHLIMPDNAITFTPGTGTALPMVAISTAEEVEKASPKITRVAKPKKRVIPYVTPSIPRTPGRSQEWRKLPRQEWEEYSGSPIALNDQGLDKRSRLNFGVRSVIDLPVVVTEEKLDAKGYVEGAITERAFLNLGDEVVISPESEGSFQVGDLYAIVGDPNSIGASQSDRSGYSYPVYGKVKITGVRDGQFIGTLVSMRLQISRGAMIVPLPPVPVLHRPIPAPAKQEAVILKDPFLTPGVVSQQRFVLADRGADDGVKTGMVFRSYDYEDRYSGKHLIDSDLFPNSDFIVAFAWPKFSLVIQTRGDQMYDNGIPVILLTDVSDLTQSKNARVVPVFENKGSESDDLEGLDTTPGIGKKEEEELKQLEEAASGKKAAPPEPVPAPEPLPEPSAAPPPPEPEPNAPPPPEPLPDEVPPPALDAPAGGTPAPAPNEAPPSGDLDIGDTPPSSDEPPPPPPEG
jgi:hypothetical protein